MQVKAELATVDKANTVTESLARVNFHPECEAAINEQINIEYAISYVYHSLYAYFDRDNVGLPGFAKYFKAASDEEREHAELLMQYQLNFQKLRELHDVADKHGDASFADFVEGQLLADQVESVKKAAEQVSQLRRVGQGLGVYLYDKELGA
ncbi:ferritin [Haematococcus lacustris]|uniref:Ferritin n=1 Tax=Haematococcus lacustris TaxID=44745 RepID=A0A699Z3W2_HAELA|nr:ferritin [Haematococcus lacustris]